MGKFCIAGYCSKSNKDGVSLHRFPKLEPYRSLWIRAVKNTRKDWHRPTNNSFLCSAHFTEDSFVELVGKRFTDFGLSPQKLRRLKPDAVPTLFGISVNELATEEASTSEASQGPGPSTSETLTKPGPSQPRTGDTPFVWEGTVKRRKIGGAFEKRERSRTLFDAEEGVLQGAARQVGRATVRELLEKESILDTQYQQLSSESAQVQDIPPSNPSVDTATGENPETKSKAQGTQTDTEGVVEAYVQCDLVPLPPLELKAQGVNVAQVQGEKTPERTAPVPQTSCEVSPTKSFSEGSEDSSGPSGPKQASSPTYEPSSHSSDVHSDGDHISPPKSAPAANQGRLFLVMESCLLMLFKVCDLCMGPVETVVWKTVGTFVRIKKQCRDCGNIAFWDSQEFVSGMPEGNLKLSAGILFSGSKPSQALRVLSHMKCPVITLRTFTRHQTKWLHPVVGRLWKQKQSEMLEGLKEIGVPVNIGGDGRSDSPGHSAKYGSYTFIDLDWNMVIHQELVQSNEVSSSNAMELEGLKRGLEFLAHQDLDVESLVTDRHRSVAKFMREEHDDINHYYDVWHVAKGVSKKIEKVAKKKSCVAAHGWARSISNHLYWVAASTPDGNGDVMLAKWLSVANHIQDVHEHDSPLFPKCLHGPLDQSVRKKKWLKPSTEVCEKVVGVITNNMLQKDVKQLSPAHQTSNVEGFHSVVIHFAPKSTHFSYRTMISRLQLAALHYNENASRPQATTKDGQQRYTLKFPKYKKGQATVSRVLSDATYEYVNELMTLMMDQCREGGDPHAGCDPVSVPPSLASAYFHPEKGEAVQQHQSRFKQT